MGDFSSSIFPWMAHSATSFTTTTSFAFFDELFRSNGDAIRRATLLRLLVEEEDKLGCGLERLELANERMATGHKLITKQQTRLSELAHDGDGAKAANELLETLLQTQAQFERYRQRILKNLHHNIL